jgi:hypothetical protein
VWDNAGLICSASYWQLKMTFGDLGKLVILIPKVSQRLRSKREWVP